LKVKSLVLFAFFASLYANLLANEPSLRPPYRVNLELGFPNGGQINRDSFLYRGGFSVGAGIVKPLNTWLNAGLNLRFTKLQTEVFLPISAKVEVNAKGRQTGSFFIFEGGYAHGFNWNPNPIVSSSFAGGTFFSSGYAYRFDIGNGKSLDIKIDLMQQNGKNRVSTLNEVGFKTSFSYLMIVPGFRLHL